MGELGARRVERQRPDSDERAVTLLRPSADPFYDAPQDLAALTPGSMVRTRRVRLGLLGIGTRDRLSLTLVPRAWPSWPRWVWQP